MTSRNIFFAWLMASLTLAAPHVVIVAIVLTWLWFIVNVLS